MAVTSKFFGLFWKSLANKEIDMDSDTFKLALFTSTLSINQDTNQYFDAAPFTSNQVANGNGYTTGGATVSPLTVTYTSGTNTLSFDASDASWTASTFTARYAVLYDSTPASNKPVVLYLDFGTDQSPSNGTLSVTWDASGIGYVTVA
jgi:hypothetical protein